LAWAGWPGSNGSLIGTNAAVPADADAPVDALPAESLTTGLALAVCGLVLVGLLVQPASTTIPTVAAAPHQADCFMT
jgi:hypothetical protein